MEETEYFVATSEIVDKIIRTLEMDISKINEQEKQILGAFCFGILNGYSLKTQISAVQIQSAMIAMLVQKFQYDPAVAAQFCDFLIRCTERNYHPTMNAIIHRGIEGYYQLGDPEKLRENISEIIKMVKKYND
ncbi:hypothetical protein IZU99_03160 [Oscillospiraceae bacterium CM]|nr:hypothetical protein IZU99_03160 [Oscillospiraceae bacterium CM]